MYMKEHTLVPVLLPAEKPNSLRQIDLRPFLALKKGDEIIDETGTVFCVVGEDAHESGDASYDGWLFYDEKGNSYFPEDFQCQKFKTMMQFDKPIHLVLDADEYISAGAHTFREYANLMQYPDACRVKMSVEVNNLLTKAINDGRLSAWQALKCGEYGCVRDGEYLERTSPDYRFDDNGHEYIAFPDVEEMKAILDAYERSREKAINLPEAIAKLKKDAEALGAVLNLEAEDFIDANHLYCVWYGHNFPGSVEYNGYRLVVGAFGEVIISGAEGSEYENLLYVNKFGDGAWFSHSNDSLRNAFHSDAELNAAEQSGKITSVNNNWLEYVILDADGNAICESEVADTDNLLEFFDPISAVIEMMKETISFHDAGKSAPEESTEAPDDFEAYIAEIRSNGHTLSCPIGCSALGALCNGDCYTTPCGRALEYDADGNECGRECDGE